MNKGKPGPLKWETCTLTFFVLLSVYFRVRQHQVWIAVFVEACSAVAKPKNRHVAGMPEG